MISREQQSERIRKLNDQFREAGPIPFAQGQWIITSGLLELGPVAAYEAIQAVRRFTDFDDANDPYGEHDFGTFVVAGERCFWKIDYYDPKRCFGSTDPGNPKLTCRVMSLMLASDY